MWAQISLVRGGVGRQLDPGEGSGLSGVWDDVWKRSPEESLTFPERSFGPTAQDAS